MIGERKINFLGKRVSRRWDLMKLQRDRRNEGELMKGRE